jgi:pimeloyl-ACP methyl ester carboxylesterase
MAGALRAHAPDALLGFSQGATAAALLLAQLAARRAEGADLDVPLPKRAILVRHSGASGPGGQHLGLRRCASGVGASPGEPLGPGAAPTAVAGGRLLARAASLGAHHPHPPWHRPSPQWPPQCAGFLPRDPKYAGLLEAARVAVPSLFICGDADTLVPPERTLALMATFDPATAALLRHPGRRQWARSATWGLAVWMSVKGACNACTLHFVPFCLSHRPCFLSLAPNRSGAHMVPTCSGDVKRQIIEFLDQGVGADGAASSEAEAEAAVMA